MKNLGIIQARLSSTRFYGKIMHPLQSRPMLAALARRMQSATRIDTWWLATTERAEDDVTAHWGQALGLHVHRGSESDVLSRFTAIVRRQPRVPDWVVRIPADAPFTDGAVVDRTLQQAATAPASVALLIDTHDTGLPLGYIHSVVRAEALLSMESRIPADQPYHRVHVTSWLNNERDRTAFRPPADWPRRPHWRWTVDTIEDANMAEQAFALFSDHWPDIVYPDMVSALDARPDITALNAHIQQKALEEG
jgi:spore coat polysaccharide biosynthesis protein SpsF